MKLFLVFSVLLVNIFRKYFFEFFFILLVMIQAASVTAVPTPIQNTFDIEAFDMSMVLPKRDTEEKFKCIQDGTQKLFDENTDLYWWFDEGGKTGLKLIENFEKCDALSGLAQA